MNFYELSRSFWDFSFENPDKVRPNHISIYFFAIEHCNRLGWKKKFGLPTSMVMEAIGVKSYNTYIASFKDLVDWGFFELVQKSKNQYSSNVIQLSNFNKALDKALDKALIKHGTKQSESTEQSIDSIDKQYTSLQETNIPENDFIFSNQNSKEVIQLSKEIGSFFQISEISNPNQFMKIGNFVRCLEGKGKLDHLDKQFKGYKVVKNDGKFIHSIENYMGSTDKSYEDGQWNSKLWYKNGSEHQLVVSSPKRLNRNPS